MKRDTKIIISLVIMIIAAGIIGESTDKNISPENPFSAKNGLEYWASQRYYPNNKLPGDGIIKAYRDSEILRKTNTPPVAPDTWEAMGPANIGGRTIALAMHPDDTNTLYAGAASGGLWRLTFTGTGDNDYNWTRVETGYPVLGVNAIAMDPADKDVIYIGTGEVYGYKEQDGTAEFGSRWMRIRGNYGLGILKSTDGGETWTKSLDWTKQMENGVLALEVHPENSDIVFAGTTEGVYRSEDAGGSWERVLTRIMVVDVDINPDNPEIVFASCGNLGSSGNGIYRSTNGGDTWEQLTNGLPDGWGGKTLLDIYQASPNIIYADICNYAERIGLYKSEDSGDTWEFVSGVVGVNLYVGQGYFSHFVRVNPVDNNKIFMAKVGYADSDDGGITYTTIYQSTYDFVTSPEIIAHGDIHEFFNHPDDPDKFFLGTDGGVFITEDGGRYFRNLNNGFQTTQFYPGFASSNTNPDLGAGGFQDNGSAVYTGSAQWDWWVGWGDGGYAAIDQNNNDVVYLSSQFLSIYKSSNRFNSTLFDDTDDWSYATPHNRSQPRHPDQEWAAFIAPFVLATSNRMYAATNYVYRSDDAGETWEHLNNDQPLSGLPVVSLAASRSNPNVVYAATVPYNPDNIRPRFYASFNAGTSFTDYTQGLPDRYIVDVAVSPHNENAVYAALSGYGTSHLYRSTNGGRNWHDVGSGLPDLPTNVVICDPEDFSNVYVGNDLGVWVSTDYCQTWYEFSEGLPEAVISMDLSISESDRKLRVLTHGNGAYFRSLLPADGMPPDVVEVPLEYELHQNFPNPFNPTTTISFELSRKEVVSLKIYNILGQEVRSFPEIEYEQGLNNVEWNGLDDRGMAVASGTYIYRIRVNGSMTSKRMTLVR
ncbi:MAG: T9SS type A sorting domain-containing protein [bacterium]|nr:T9SS type A sorting domain-containing protein [bacterium]